MKFFFKFSNTIPITKSSSKLFSIECSLESSFPTLTEIVVLSSLSNNIMIIIEMTDKEDKVTCI